MGLLFLYFIVAVFTLSLVLVITIRNINQDFNINKKIYRDVAHQFLQLVKNIMNVKMDAEDAYENGHLARVAAYSVEIAIRMGMDKNFIKNLFYVGLLHDVGKIIVPREIINKSGKLTDEEYEIIKSHTNIGNKILKNINVFKNLATGALEHHERWMEMVIIRGKKAKIYHLKLA
jgi:putative nucleotidyltransferase with HDIG domain